MFKDPDSSLHPTDRTTVSQTQSTMSRHREIGSIQDRELSDLLLLTLRSMTGGGGPTLLYFLRCHERIQRDSAPPTTSHRAEESFRIVSFFILVVTTGSLTSTFIWKFLGLTLLLVHLVLYFLIITTNLPPPLLCSAPLLAVTVNK